MRTRIAPSRDQKYIKRSTQSGLLTWTSLAQLDGARNADLAQLFRSENSLWNLGAVRTVDMKAADSDTSRPYHGLRAAPPG
eukprot:6334902-Lingulodinium_polyedra.AAC.1